MAKKGSVLVVDDEEIMRDVLETLLSAEGYRVDLARTGEEGLEAYGRRAYDVVLLDVSMPGMGGLRALEELLKVDAEAVVVRRIFDLCAAGQGLRTIAKTLNEDRVPTPRAQQGRPSAWISTSIRERSGCMTASRKISRRFTRCAKKFRAKH